MRLPIRPYMRILSLVSASRHAGKAWQLLRTKHGDMAGGQKFRDGLRATHVAKFRSFVKAIKFIWLLSRKRIWRKAEVEYKPIGDEINYFGFYRKALEK